MGRLYSFKNVFSNEEIINISLLKNSFVFSFLLGLWGHGYAFLNLILSLDSLNEFYSFMGNHGWQIKYSGSVVKTQI